jgi:seryl-tRNA synthetase
MAFVSKIGAALAGSAEKVVDAPVRAIVEELLAERGVPGRDELAAANSRVSALQTAQTTLAARLDAAEAKEAELAAELQRLVATVDELQRDLAESREQLVQAQAEAEEARTIAADAAARAPEADDRPVVGEDGAVVVRDSTFYVDPALAGEPYTVTSRGGLSIGGRFVKRHKSPVQTGD